MKRLFITLFATLSCFLCKAGIADTKEVVEVKTMTELQELIKSSNKTIFLDCYSKRCPPCMRLAPRYEQYAKDLSDKGVFAKVNLDQVREVLSTYDVQAMPTLLIFSKGVVKDKKVGFPDIVDYFETMKPKRDKSSS